MDTKGLVDLLCQATIHYPKNIQSAKVENTAEADVAAAQQEQSKLEDDKSKQNISEAAAGEEEDNKSTQQDTVN